MAFTKTPRYRRDDFVAYVTKTFPAPFADVATFTKAGRTKLVLHSADEHAVHAVELVAARYDLKTVRWHNTDAAGRMGLELSGFAPDLRGGFVGPGRPI